MITLFIIAGYVLISAGLYAALRIRCKKDPVFRAPKSSAVFYAVSLTWGLPTVLPGAIVALFLRLRGRKPVKTGREWGFLLPGVNWGLSLGLFFIAPVRSRSTALHEVGHGIQNFYLGPFMPAVVLIPSFIRFWFFRIQRKRGRTPANRYDGVWFERSAAASGEALSV
ncbi:MAG: hypothetical protein IKN36_01945 [Clostridia bacterium]|nr:hypothetical protein [Clostridia bacterium]MBR7033090.1 hypothetical protein [Clostridia bacterium]